MRFLRCTLVHILSGNKILLGLKKRGFGVGKWNGFGGKIENGETVKRTAVREVEEECGLVIKETDLEDVGVILFDFVGENFVLEINIFKATSFTGNITESDEMKPKWFTRDEIPFDKMWVDDIQWFPNMFKDNLFYGFMKCEGHDKILYQELSVVKTVEDVAILNRTKLKKYCLEN